MTDRISERQRQTEIGRKAERQTERERYGQGSSEPDRQRKILAGKQRDRQTEKDIGREVERQTDRERYWKGSRETDRERKILAGSRQTDRGRFWQVSRDYRYITRQIVNRQHISFKLTDDVLYQLVPQLLYQLVSQFTVRRYEIAFQEKSLSMSTNATKRKLPYYQISLHMLVFSLNNHLI